MTRSGRLRLRFGRPRRLGPTRRISPRKPREAPQPARRARCTAATVTRATPAAAQPTPAALPIIAALRITGGPASPAAMAGRGRRSAKVLLDALKWPQKRRQRLRDVELPETLQCRQRL